MAQAAIYHYSPHCVVVKPVTTENMKVGSLVMPCSVLYCEHGFWCHELSTL